MELNFLLVEQRNSRLVPWIRNDSVLFLVTDNEAREVRLRIQNCAGARVASAGPFHAPPEQLGRCGTIAVTENPTVSAGLVEFLLRRHRRGTRVIAYRTALLEFDPSFPVRGNSLVTDLTRHSIHQNPVLRLYSAFKRLFEPLIAILLLLTLSPLLLAVALAVLVTSPGPVLYAQLRTGLNGHRFRLLKFRSMRKDAENSGPQWASTDRDESRLTPLGRLLRSTHLDELPQLWNIVKGDLAFIGPRPERPFFVEKICAVEPAFGLRTWVKPGITGWAQVTHGYANTIEDSVRKLEYDLFYVFRQSPAMDAWIIGCTLKLLFSGGTERRRRRLPSIVSTQSRDLEVQSELKAVNY